MLKNEEILGSEDFCNDGNTIFDRRRYNDRLDKIDHHQFIKVRKY